MNNSTQQIGIAVPAQLIEDLVRAAIVRELGNQDALIDGIVRAAISAKDPNGYRGETLFMKTVEKMIRDEAEAVLREWVLESKDKIRAAFVKHLNSRDGAAVKKLAEGMIDGLGNYSVGVSFNWERLK